MDMKNELRARLDKARPDRYDEGDKQWVDRVADGMECALSDSQRDEIIGEHMRRIARELEGQATKGGNSIMRHFHRTRQLPLDWKLSVNLPISFTNTVMRDGRAETVRERVKLCRATAADFEAWAETEEQARQRDYTARGEAVNGALQIAMEMKAAGVLTFSTWAEEFAPVEENAA